MNSFLTEQDIISYWKNNKIFEKTLNNNKNLPKYVFYDGPPFATGLPHYGHIVASTIKDIIPRYKSQNGYYVERVFGWDTHGLPIEFKIEEKLGIKTKQDVLKFGIDNYNEECRKIVLQYRSEWKKTIERLGRWVDLDNDYKTMDINYMESVWWVFSELYKKGLVYKGVKIMPYSNGCTTPLSNFEATSNYKSVSDPSLTVKFKTIFKNIEFNILVWTTTPWTLPTNLALCVNPNYLYLLVNSNKNNQNYIIQKDCLKKYFKDESYTLIDTITGKELENLKYEPLFNYYKHKYKAFYILNDDYVTNENGTGIVHISPAFGKDDYRVCLEKKIITKELKPPCPINENGIFTDEVIDFANIYIKDADTLIVKYLKEANIIFRYNKETHQYPYCWRSNTPLIYKTVSSWFINVEKIKDKICANNLETSWVPSNIRDNKFGKWLENSIDWCFSRNRYWGTPIPLWVSDDFEEIVCIESISQLEDLANLPKGSIKDIHRHHIDNITIESKNGKGKLKRISEVFDCWFESGSMPYAQHGYPNTDKVLKDIFPADFIAEGTDQTRGWFYTLMVLSTALFNKPAFKNVIVNGLVLAKDGEKMSKSKQNYPKVDNIFEQFGADAVRLYLINGPVVKAGDLKFNERDIKTIVKNVNLLMYNMTNYLIQMIDLYQTKKPFDLLEIDKSNKNLKLNPIDVWILQYTNNFVKCIHTDLENYQLYYIVDRIIILIDRLSRWYLKLNKNQFNEGNITVLSVFYYCLYNVIVTIAPFTPFMSEIIYQKLKKYKDGPESVHLIQMKKTIWETNIDVLLTMDDLYKIINATRIIRTQKINRARKMPVNELVIINNNNDKLKHISKLEDYIYEEVNVMDIKYSSNESEYLNYKLKINPKLGKILKNKFKDVENYITNLDYEEVLQIVKNKQKIKIDMKIDDKDFTLNFNDLVIDKTLKNNYEEYVYHIDSDYLILMDTKITDQMQTKYQIKLLVRFLQDFRKEINLTPSDKLYIYYESENHKIYNNILVNVSNLIRNNITLYTNKIKFKTSREYLLLEDSIKFYFNY